jgi:hypothetical protein
MLIARFRARSLVTAIVFCAGLGAATGRANAGFVVTDASSSASVDGLFSYTFDNGASYAYYEPYNDYQYGSLNTNPTFSYYYYNLPYFPYVSSYANGNNSVDTDVVANHIYVDSYAGAYVDPNSYYGGFAQAESSGGGQVGFYLDTTSTAVLHFYANSGRYDTYDSPYSYGSTTTYLIYNGGLLYSYNIASYGDGTVAGDPVDVTFSVTLAPGYYGLLSTSHSVADEINGSGFGAGQYSYSGASLSQITPVPAPSSLTLILNGALGPIAWCFRWRAQQRKLERLAPESHARGHFA